jgi:hypothetical protein
LHGREERRGPVVPPSRSRPKEKKERKKDLKKETKTPKPLHLWEKQAQITMLPINTKTHAVERQAKRVLLKTRVRCALAGAPATPTSAKKKTQERRNKPSHERCERQHKTHPGCHFSEQSIQTVTSTVCAATGPGHASPPPPQKRILSVSRFFPVARQRAPCGLDDSGKTASLVHDLAPAASLNLLSVAHDTHTHLVCVH